MQRVITDLTRVQKISSSYVTMYKTLMLLDSILIVVVFVGVKVLWVISKKEES